MGIQPILEGGLSSEQSCVTVRRYTDDSKHSPLISRGKLCSTARRSIINRFNFIVKFSRYKEFKGNYAFWVEIKK